MVMLKESMSFYFICSEQTTEMKRRGSSRRRARERERDWHFTHCDRSGHCSTTQSTWPLLCLYCLSTCLTLYLLLLILLYEVSPTMQKAVVAQRKGGAKRDEEAMAKKIKSFNPDWTVHSGMLHKPSSTGLWRSWPLFFCLCIFLCDFSTEDRKKE